MLSLQSETRMERDNITRSLQALAACVDGYFCVMIARVQPPPTQVLQKFGTMGLGIPSKRAFDASGECGIARLYIGRPHDCNTMNGVHNPQASF